jgi:hypothetical protein
MSTAPKRGGLSMRRNNSLPHFDGVVACGEPQAVRVGVEFFVSARD